MRPQNQKLDFPRYDFWDKRRNKVYSSVGGWQSGRDVHSYGHSLIHELMGNISYMQMVILNITGRIVEKKLARWFEGNFIGLSYPDSRIWCNAVGAMVGAMKGSPVAASVAGTLAADSKLYGGSKTSLIGINFIRQAQKDYTSGLAVQEIIANAPHRNGVPVINGFARPIKAKDERIEAYERLTQKLGFEVGEHLSLAYQIDEYLERNYGLGMNAGGYTCAFYADQGLSAEEVYQIKSIAVASGVMASFIDNRRRDPDSYMPMRCDDMVYEGTPPRNL